MHNSLNTMRVLLALGLTGLATAPLQELHPARITPRMWTSLSRSKRKAHKPAHLRTAEDLQALELAGIRRMLREKARAFYRERTLARWQHCPHLPLGDRNAYEVQP